MALLMRRRLQFFLPIVLIALVVQIFAPIGAAWAAAIAASDPLAAAEICHASATGAADQQDRQGGQPSDHDGACSICCLAGAIASVDAPRPVALAEPYRAPERVVWRERAFARAQSRTGSNAQARAPPALPS